MLYQTRESASSANPMTSQRLDPLDHRVMSHRRPHGVMVQRPESSLPRRKIHFVQELRSEARSEKTPGVGQEGFQ